jgi:UDP-N-acetylglucosamine:LPS N-acetylglucosamine transferase
MVKTGVPRTPTQSDRPVGPKVVAVASAGGHWTQLMQVLPAFEGLDIHFAGTDPRLAHSSGLTGMTGLRDSNRSRPFRVLATVWDAGRLILKTRPDVVVTTGAAPGLLALVWGRAFGARTIWIDSIANSQKLSLSGRLARRFATHTVTQWAHLADDSGPRRPILFWGSVL